MVKWRSEIGGGEDHKIEERKREEWSRGEEVRYNRQGCVLERDVKRLESGTKETIMDYQMRRRKSNGGNVVWKTERRTR